MKTRSWETAVVSAALSFSHLCGREAVAIPGLVDTRRRVSPLLSRIAVSLALVLGPSRGNPCQGPTIGRSSSHLINNPPTMSTPSDSQLINDRRTASQCRRWPLRDPACSADRWFTRGTEAGDWSWITSNLLRRAIYTGQSNMDRDQSAWNVDRRGKNCSSLYRFRCVECNRSTNNALVSKAPTNRANVIFIIHWNFVCGKFIAASYFCLIIFAKVTIRLCQYFQKNNWRNRI